MPLLAGLAVVFAGIAGNHDHRVEQQLRLLTAQLHVAATKVSSADLAVIGHHGEGAREVVQRLHADGVIAGEYVLVGGHATVRLIVYGADGGMRSLSELPLTERVLDLGDLESLHDNLQDEVSSLMAMVKPPVEKAPAVENVAVVEKPPAARKPAVVEKPRAEKPRVAEKPAVVEQLVSEPSVSEESKPATPDAAPADSGGVSVAELEAVTSGGDAADDSVTASAPAPAPDELHLRASIGIGATARNFAPGPVTLPAYGSTAVGAVRFAASVQPTARIVLSGLAERTLEMTSPVASQMAATAISHWELAGDYQLIGGSFAVLPQVGLGHRGFSIDSADPARSPAVDYSYAMLGVRSVAALGSRIKLHTHATFEPVLGGTDPMQMAYGSATRWAFDVGAAVEVRVSEHLFARAAADYQRFSWSWSEVGSRGAGGAADSYPSGTVSLGAEY